MDGSVPQTGSPGAAGNQPARVFMVKMSMTFNPAVPLLDVLTAFHITLIVFYAALPALTNYGSRI